MEAKSNEWQGTQTKNLKQLAYWTAAWGLTLVLPAFGPKFLWDYNSSISILAILVNTIIGVGIILMPQEVCQWP